MRVINDPVKARKSLVKHLEDILDKKKYAINIEKGIYNYTIEDANRKNLVKKWENIHFVEIYLARFRTIYNNLKINPLAYLIYYYYLQIF